MNIESLESVKHYTGVKCYN